jgi:hypothetical protein
VSNRAVNLSLKKRVTVLHYAETAQQYSILSKKALQPDVFSQLFILKAFEIGGSEVLRVIHGG